MQPELQRQFGGRTAFTLVELLVVVSIIALLIGVLLPSLRQAREQAKATVCLGQLHTLGQGIAMYTLDNNDAMAPGRLPNLGDGVNWQMKVAGGMKYRPTFLAILGAYVGVPAFDDPKATRSEVDRFGEAGDRQDYSNRIYVCPTVARWTDERNGSYGYNYQFLGNSRLRDEADPYSFKNWPVRTSQVRGPSRCVAIADSMGTAASFAHPSAYENNGRDHEQLGNEGFNLDPPAVNPSQGEMADLDGNPPSRSAPHARHIKRCAVLWLDAHCSVQTLPSLGYDVQADGIVGLNGDNQHFSADATSGAWVQSD